MKTQNTGEDEVNALGELISTLRRQAKGIAKEGHYGWGNTMSAAADALERLAPSPTSQPNETQESANATTPATSEHGTHNSGASTLAVTKEAEEAAVLEISANHIRALRECNAPVGTFVQKAINAALEAYRNVTSRG